MFEGVEGRQSDIMIFLEADCFDFSIGGSAR